MFTCVSVHVHDVVVDVLVVGDRRDLVVPGDTRLDAAVLLWIGEDLVLLGLGSGNRI